MDSANKWYRIALFNLLILAIMGFLLRYKIAFSFPFVDQKHLLHGHSHFAFSGWVGLALMSLQIHIISTFKGIDLFSRYKPLLIFTMIASWGMLISFLYQGYGFISIAFSTLFTFVNYLYILYMWRDLRRAHGLPLMTLVFKSALIANVVSSVGTFALAVLMANHVVNQKLYIASVYFYLHFQYNGFFILTCLGILLFFLRNVTSISVKMKLSIILFIAAVIPAYFLSTLWMKIPWLLYFVIILSALAQLLALGLLYFELRPLVKIYIKKSTVLSKWLLALVFLAFSIKIILQAGSTLPALSTVAFGFRPIVIGYLHLVLLGVVTLFIIYSITQLISLKLTPLFRNGVYLFSGAIVLNEVLLMLQGAAALEYIVMPLSNEFLLLAAFLMIIGLVCIQFGLSGKKKI